MHFHKRLLFRALFVLFPCLVIAQENKSSFEIYGYVMVDGGYNFNSINPAWSDVMRPTQLPKFKNEYGADGNYFIGVRQTRFGVRRITDTKWGQLKAQFDFDLFGFGKDVGQTTIHVVNGFLQLGKFIVGQTPSTFMDTDVFPVTLDYWGPSSRIFYLNIQMRYTPVYNEKKRFAIALERPGGTADGTDYSNSVEVGHLKPRLPLPNLVSHYRQTWKWGHVQVAGIAKCIQWRDVSDTSIYNLDGGDIGWGFTASTVFNATKRLKFKIQGEYGEGFTNYVADPSPDIALQSNPGSTLTPVKGKALPMWGIFCFVEMEWTQKLRTSAGYSAMTITNSDLQSPQAFRQGQYVLMNLRYYPVDDLMMGIEYQYGRRDNHSDGFHSTANKIQFSFKFNFSYKTEMK